MLCCCVLCSFVAACCAVSSGAARRPGALCFAALCFALFPRAVCSVLCVFCRRVLVRTVARRCAACCVYPGVSRCSLSSLLCAVLCSFVLLRLHCAVRVVRAVAGAWCCGALLCVVLFPLVGCGAVLGPATRGRLLTVCFGVGVPVWPRGLVPCGWCGLLWCPASLCRVLGLFGLAVFMLISFIFSYSETFFVVFYLSFYSHRQFLEVWVFLPTRILQITREITKRTFRPFLGAWLSYGIHIPFIPLIRCFETLGIIRLRRSFGLPYRIQVFLNRLGTPEIQECHVGALIQWQQPPFLLILMTLDSVFLSEFHLAEKGTRSGT